MATNPNAPWRRRCGVFLMLAAVLCGAAAQSQAQAPAPAAAGSPAGSDKSTPQPIPLSEVATEAESVSARLRDMQAELASESVADAIASQLPTLTREIDARLRETRTIMAQRPSLETLSGLEAEWRRVRSTLAGWARQLARRVERLEGDMAQLDELTKIWQQTLTTAQNDNAPADVVAHIAAVITAIGRARDALDRERAQVLTLQTRVAAQDARVTEATELIQRARADILKRLFVKDSPEIWRASAQATGAADLQADARNSLATQVYDLSWYAERQIVRFLLHAALAIALFGAFYIARRKARAHSADRIEDAQAARLFDNPIAAALLLSFLASRWIYPQAPRVLWAVLGAGVLIPSVVVLRRTIERELRPMLYALAVFYGIDQVRIVGAAVQFFPRLLFAAEMLGATLFGVWLIRALHSATEPAAEARRSRKTIAVATHVGAAICALSFVANVFGYVTLANFLGGAFLASAYVAVALTALLEILSALAALALAVPPLALFGVVRRHRELLYRRVRSGLKWLAIFLWAVFTLDRLLVREPLFRAVHDILTRELSVGALRLSLGDVLAFALTVWAATLASRFVRFLLEEEVYPRVRLTRGLPYAISTTVHYVILFVGFLMAVAALGLDMTKVTILAGAFSVGVGLGLQSIFNNFVSGLILLFERPVNVGDVIQIDDASGVIEHIGIRASVIRTPNGSEVIVPNSKLIADRVVNWTFSGGQRSIELPVTVAQGADPGHVIQVLERTAASHPLVTKEPPPEALVVKLGPDSLALELRAWTDRVEGWMRVRSELAIAVNAALTAEHIAIR